MRAATACHERDHCGETALVTNPPAREHRIFRIVRSSTTLIIIGLGLGLALAAGLGTLIWAIATALHHASSN